MRGRDMSPDKQLLTIEEFAKQLRISRSTACSWLASGRLVSGTHVLRIGSIVRIVWSDELFCHLLGQSTVNEHRPRLKRQGKGGKNVCALDMEYLKAD